MNKSSVDNLALGLSIPLRIGTPELARDVMASLAAPTLLDSDVDICGLCGESGADKYAHPMHWPGEQVPDGPLVHDECEKEECRRAHQEFWNRVGEKGVREFLRSI